MVPRCDEDFFSIEEVLRALKGLTNKNALRYTDLASQGSLT